MTKRKLNPEGTLLQFGAGVRLERGPETPEPDAPIVWTVFERKDVSGDPDTTYDYRFEVVASYAETEPGEPPAEAIERAEALAAA